jgi:uncharacterized protein YdeI (YjbR/CyaY-like superfamily)
VPDIKEFPKNDVKALLKQAYSLSLDGLKARPQTPNGQTIVKSISEKKRRPGMSKPAAPPRRKKHPMPNFVLDALKKTKLFDAYESRPPYQRNDYIGWITSAKQEATQRRRLQQMLDELSGGDRYMKMPYRTSRS